MAGLKKKSLVPCFKTNLIPSLPVPVGEMVSISVCPSFILIINSSPSKKISYGKVFSLYLDQKDLIHGIAPLLMLLLPYGTCCPYQSDPVAAWLL